MILIGSSFWWCFLSLLYLIVYCFCKTQKPERQRVGLFVRNRCVAGNSVSYLTSRANPKCSGDCTDTFVSSEMQKQELFMFWKLHNMKAGDEKYYCRTIQVQKIRYIFLVRISCVQILTKCNIQILYILQAHLRPLESPATDKQTKLPYFSYALFSPWIVFSSDLSFVLQHLSILAFCVPSCFSSYLSPLR